MISQFFICTFRKKEIKGKYITYTEKYVNNTPDSPSASWDTYMFDLGGGRYRYFGDFNPRDITYLEQKIKKQMKNIYKIRFTFHNRKNQDTFFTFEYELKEPLSTRGNELTLEFDMEWNSNTNKVMSFLTLNEKIGGIMGGTNTIDNKLIHDIPTNLNKDETDKKLLTTIDVFVDFVE